jgi:hypothetical protein
VAGGEIADVHRHSGECLHLHRLPLGEKAADDATLIEYFNGAGVQTSGARAFELEAGAWLDDEDVGPRQRQLRRQHHPRRTASGDHNWMLRHTPLLVSRRLSENSAPYPGVRSLVTQRRPNDPCRTHETVPVLTYCSTMRFLGRRKPSVMPISGHRSEYLVGVEHYQGIRLSCHNCG